MNTVIEQRLRRTQEGRKRPPQCRDPTSYITYMYLILFQINTVLGVQTSGISCVRFYAQVQRGSRNPPAFASGGGPQLKRLRITIANQFVELVLSKLWGSDSAVITDAIIMYPSDNYPTWILQE